MSRHSKEGTRDAASLQCLLGALPVFTLGLLNRVSRRSARLRVAVHRMQSDLTDDAGV